AQAKEVVLSDKKTSISYLQRKLQIGYNRSANIIEQLEATGVLSAPNNKGNREIL
ncbi:MAG: DNA translocase FtsK, partial [Campylobacterota bacterium]|nr:DNA translocase FtsK [Campylobacterota bacterium]